MRGDRGSVFVESLVAVALVAVMSAALFGLVAQSAARRGAVEQRRVAFLVARSHLDAAAVEAGAEGGRATGEDSGLLWESRSEPAAQAGASDGARLDRVEVVVRARQGGPALARLATLRVGVAP